MKDDEPRKLSLGEAFQMMLAGLMVILPYLGVLLLAVLAAWGLWLLAF